MALLNVTTVCNRYPFFFVEGVTLLKGLLYIIVVFFFAEGVAFLKGTTLYNSGCFSLLKALPY